MPEANSAKIMPEDIDARLLATQAAELRRAKQEAAEAGKGDDNAGEAPPASLRQAMAMQRRAEAVQAKQAAQAAKLAGGAAEKSGIEMVGKKIGGVLVELIPGKSFHTMLKQVVVGGSRLGIVRIIVMVFSNGLYVLIGLAALAIIVLIVDWANADWIDKAKIFLGAITKLSWEGLKELIGLFKPFGDIFKD